MPKAVTLGNGNLLVCLDKYGQVRDFYYHYAGLDNHIGDKMVHKIGVFLDGGISWMDTAGWEVKAEIENDTMAGKILCINSELGIDMRFSDVVYNEQDIFLRKIEVKNLFDRKRDLRIFFDQQFDIGTNHHSDTAYFEPRENVIIHYEGRRVFLVNTLFEGKSFTDYSIGLIGIEGKEGTFKDAEDGKLSQSPIEHGQVDSVVGVDISLDVADTKTLFYWIAAAKSIKKVKEVNKYVLDVNPAHILESTKDYWRAWVKNQNFTFYGLSDAIIDQFNRSLVVIRTHVSSNGAIIASGDSDMLQYGRDTYSYMWPRDSAFSAIALAKAGDFNASKRFFEFCNDVITPDGYFMHKYRPDKSLGSSWHPWVVKGEVQLPIQEDETALVVNALWTYFELSKDLEFIESIYNSLIKKACEFMTFYIDEKTGLPKPSYDIWEEKFGIHTFTASTVFGALRVASRFAKLLGKDESASKYENASLAIKSAILNNLFDEKSKYFYRSVYIDNGELIPDKTMDISSVYGVYKFGVLGVDDSKLKDAVKVTKERLSLKTDIGGVARYEGDVYLGRGGNVPGNPWIITTLWMTQYDIEFIKEEKELPELVKKFTWVVKRAHDSGVLPEQVDPYTGEQLSAAPLTWSHAEYVISIIKYLEKLEELGICKACYPVDSHK